MTTIGTFATRIETVKSLLNASKLILVGLGRRSTSKMANETEVRVMHCGRAAILPVVAAMIVLGGCRTTEKANALTPIAFPISVGQSIMVSAADPGWEHAEYMADADPTDPGRVMVCSMRFSQEENRLTSAVYNSFDSGSSWTMMVDSSAAARFGGVWDPACEYGNDGKAFFVALLLTDTATTDTTDYRFYHNWQAAGDGGMHVYRSENGGKSWAPPVILSMIDREDIKVDRTDGQYRGRIYVYGSYKQRNPLHPSFWLIYSDDGRTWKKSTEHITEGGQLRAGLLGEILPDGSLFFLRRWSPRQKEGQPRRILMAYMVSDDGGRTFSEPAVIPDASADPSPAGLAVDRSRGPFHGRIYVMSSLRFRGRSAYQVIHSDDQGKTWSNPVRATDPRAVRREPGEIVDERGMPQIVVNKDGIVGITWYDWQEGDSITRADLRFTASSDGGYSWFPSVQVSEIPLLVRKEKPEFAAQATVSGGGRRRGSNREHADSINVSLWPSPRAYYPWNFAPGDYTGIAAGADGTFHTFWTGTTNGRSELFTARVMVKTPVTAPDRGLLAGLDTLTRAFEFQVTSSVWDPSTETVTLVYQLLNTSADTIDAPIMARLARVESHLGNPTLMLDSGGRTWSGTILDLSDKVPAGGLAPNQTTLPQQLRFVLDNVNGLFNPDRDILHLKIEIYGKRRRAKANVVVGRRPMRSLRAQVALDSAANTAIATSAD